MSDLAKIGEIYTPDEAFDVELLGPDGAPLMNDDDTPMTIGVLGADSDLAISLRNKSSNRQIQQGARAKITAEGLQGEGITYLAKLSTRWNITLNDEKPTFSTDAVRALYADPKLAFIREQVDVAIANRANFLKASSKN